MKYFRTTPKVFVVDRDPRDSFLAERIFYGNRFVPTGDVLTWCKWYRATRQKAHEMMPLADSVDGAAHNGTAATHGMGDAITSSNAAMDSHDTVMHSVDTAMHSMGTVMDSMDTVTNSGDTAMHSMNAAINGGDAAAGTLELADCTQGAQAGGVCFFTLNNLVFRYEDSCQRIYRFLDVDSARHTHKRTCFVPEVSAVNIALYKRYSNMNGEVETIKRQLPEYLLDVPSGFITGKARKTDCICDAMAEADKAYAQKCAFAAYNTRLSKELRAFRKRHSPAGIGGGSVSGGGSSADGTVGEVSSSNALAARSMPLATQTMTAKQRSKKAARLLLCILTFVPCWARNLWAVRKG